MSSNGGAAVQAAPAGAPGRAAGQQQQEGGGMSGIIKNMLRMFLLTQAVQLGIKYFMAPRDPASSGATDPASAAQVSTAANAPASAAGKTPAQPGMVPLWPQGTPFDVHFYVTAGEDGRIDFSRPTLPYTSFSGMVLGDWKWQEEWNTEVVLPKSVQNNGTLYLNTFLVKEGSPLLPGQPGWAIENVYHYRKPLMSYQKLKRVRAVKNLLSNADNDHDVESDEEAKAKDAAMPIIPFYHPNITMAVISNQDTKPVTQLVPVVQQYYKTIPPAPGTLNPRFYPVIYPNTFWQLREHAYPVNETVTSVPLNIKISPMSLMKFNLYASMDESFSQAANNPAMGGAGVAEFDEVKRILLETNIFFLLLTGVVTALHTLFEMLAFKNDVSHWRNQKSQVGVSVRTIITNVFVQLIITLYLLDNNSDTSFMILFGQGIGLVIEAWKITKAVDISLVRGTGLLPFKIKISDKHGLSEEEEATKVYDKLAFKWVAWGTSPLLVGYTIYSLLYEEHRGWYSFVITTLTQFVYIFGFVQLVPQLIINWKLRSVAHMPIKSLTYKALNTVIDDLFSFIVRMPMLHRLACFRDDVVFVILLYQYWIYPVDKTRANEYGQKLEITEPDTTEMVKEDAKAKIVQDGKKESRKNR